MRRLTITFDVAFGKDDPEQADPDEVNAFGGADTINERRASDEHATPQIGFNSGTPWEDQ